MTLVGLGLIFLLILMNIQINKMSFYFLLQNVNLFIFNTAVMLLLNVVCTIAALKNFKNDFFL